MTQSVGVQILFGSNVFIVVLNTSTFEEIHLEETPGKSWIHFESSFHPTELVVEKLHPKNILSFH